MQQSSNTPDKTELFYLIYTIGKNIHTAMKGYSAQTMPRVPHLYRLNAGRNKHYDYFFTSAS